MKCNMQINGQTWVNLMGYSIFAVVCVIAHKSCISGELNLLFFLLGTKFRCCRRQRVSTFKTRRHPDA